jgi:hypothetical protein
MDALRKTVAESILRDVERDIAWLRDRCRREGEVSGYNADQVRRLEIRADKLRAELAEGIAA